MSIETNRISKLRIALRQISLTEDGKRSARVAVEALAADDQARALQQADEEAAERIARSMAYRP